MRRHYFSDKIRDQENFFHDRRHNFWSSVHCAHRNLHNGKTWLFLGQKTFQQRITFLQHTGAGIRRTQTHNTKHWRHLPAWGGFFSDGTQNTETAIFHRNVTCQSLITSDSSVKTSNQTFANVLHAQRNKGPYKGRAAIVESCNDLGWGGRRSLPSTTKTTTTAGWFPKDAPLSAAWPERCVFALSVGCEKALICTQKDKLSYVCDKEVEVRTTLYKRRPWSAEHRKW